MTLPVTSRPRCLSPWFTLPAWETCTGASVGRIGRKAYCFNGSGGRVSDNDLELPVGGESKFIASDANTIWILDENTDKATAFESLDIVTDADIRLEVTLRSGEGGGGGGGGGGGEGGTAGASSAAQVVVRLALVGPGSPAGRMVRRGVREVAGLQGTFMPSFLTNLLITPIFTV